MQEKIVWLLLLLLSINGMSSVFLEQPNSGQLFSPIGKLLVLNCTVSEGFVQTWFVTLPNISTPATSDSRRGVVLLNDHGIYVQENSQMMSQLIFNRTSPIEVMLRCIATPTGSSDETPGNQVSIIIYGSPPTPTNVSTIENGLGYINFSWTLEFFEAVAINFMLTVINLGTSTQQMFLTQEQHFTFRVQDFTSCDVYNFSVRAMADSGSSPPSEVITRSIPSLPDITLVAHSVTHSLVKTESSRFTLSIRIQGINICLDYPVLSYTIVLEDVDDSLQGRVVMANNTNITINDLADNTHYTYYTLAENLFGSSNNSARVELVTTDVQDVCICQVNDSTSYLIQCSYVEGSDARGCAYTISVDGVESVTGTIARSNTEGVIVELPDVSCVNEVLVYDWERDGTLGSLSLTVNGSSIITICPVPITAATEYVMDTVPSCVCASTAILSSVVSVVMTALLATVIFTLLQIALCKYQHKFTSRGAQSTTMTGGRLAGERELPEYEQVNEGGPTYMEVGAEGLNTMELTRNEAYGSYHH